MARAVLLLKYLGPLSCSGDGMYGVVESVFALCPELGCMSCKFNHVRNSLEFLPFCIFSWPQAWQSTNWDFSSCLGNWFCEHCVIPYFAFSFIFLSYIGCCGWVLHLYNQTWLGILTSPFKPWVSLSLPVSVSSSRKMTWLPLGLQ